MTSDVNEIYSRFYLRVQDYNLTEMCDCLVKEMLSGYIRSTISKPFVRRLFSQIALDEDIDEIEYTMREPLDEDADKDFVEEMLALGMIVAWIDPKYHSTLLTSQFFSNSEQKYYSQAQHLSELRDMFGKAQSDLRKLIRDRGWSNSYINGVT